MSTAEANILVPGVHDRLVKDIDVYAARAGIPTSAIRSPLSAVCSEEEIAFVKKLKQHESNGVFGLAYVGEPSATVSVITRMHAIAGACLRNFIDARVMTTSEVLHSASDGFDHPTVLLIPNYYVYKAGLATWHVAALLDVLTNRMVEGRQTFLYVQDLDGLKKEYGSASHAHIIQHFQIVGI